MTANDDASGADRAYKVYKIENGTVIDHLPAGTALKTIQLLGMQKGELLTVGMHFDSKHMGKKDIIKVQNRSLSQQDVNKLALLAPKATINIIKDASIIEKKAVELPGRIEGIVKCNNPKCITNNERNVRTIFSLLRAEPLRLRCHHCERVMMHDDVVLL